MGFKLYNKDKITFEIGGEEVTMLVKRLPAKKSMQFSLKVARLQDALAEAKDEDKPEISVDIFSMQVELLSEIVEGIEGIEDLEEWPSDTVDRELIFNEAGVDFVVSAVEAYNKSISKPVDENPKD